MVYRVAVGVEEGGVEVAEGLVAFPVVVREADVAAAEVELAVLAGQDDEGVFPAVAVVGFAAVGEVEEHRVVEQGALAFGRLLEAADEGVH